MGETVSGSDKESFVSSLLVLVLSKMKSFQNLYLDKSPGIYLHVVVLPMLKPLRSISCSGSSLLRDTQDPTRLTLSINMLVIRASHRTYYGYGRTAYGLYAGSSTSHPYRISQSSTVRRYSTGEITVIRPYVRRYVIKLEDRNVKFIFGNENQTLLVILIQ